MSGSIQQQTLADGIVKVTLDHQAKLNAISNTMWQQLETLFKDFSADPALRCIILCGAGDKAFSVGADISEFEQNRSTIAKARAYGKRVHSALAAISQCMHPVIAQIDGLCVGGGLELAVLSDLRICSQSSRFGIPIKRLGLVVAYPEMEGLLNLVGYANAMEILLEGSIFSADKAHHMGLVNRCVANAELDQQVIDSAQAIAEGAPLAARWHKKFAKRLQDPKPLSEAEFDEGFQCYESEDFHIGYQSFLNKTKPQFKGC